MRPLVLAALASGLLFADASLVGTEPTGSFLHAHNVGFGAHSSLDPASKRRVLQMIEKNPEPPNALRTGRQTCAGSCDAMGTGDMIQVKRYMCRYKAEKRMRLIGPNCAGIITPGQAFAGLMPSPIYLPGRIGIVGRSGTFGYEAASQMKERGIGVSTSVGIGGHHTTRPAGRNPWPCWPR